MYSEEYENSIERYKAPLEELMKERAVIRYDSIIDDARAQLDDARAQYEEGKEKYDAAKAEYDRGYAEYTQKKAATTAQLEQARKQIEDAEKMMGDTSGLRHGKRTDRVLRKPHRREKQRHCDPQRRDRAAQRRACPGSGKRRNRQGPSYPEQDRLCKPSY